MTSQFPNLLHHVLAYGLTSKNEPMNKIIIGKLESPLTMKPDLIQFIKDFKKNPNDLKIEQNVDPVTFKLNNIPHSYITQSELSMQNSVNNLSVACFTNTR